MARPPKKSAPKAKSIARPYQTTNFTPKSPAKTQTTVGAVPLSGEADKRLKPRTALQSLPSSPLPGVGQLGGSESVITDSRRYYFKLTRYNPLRILTPELLGQYFDMFEQGYLRYLALLLFYMAKRDPILVSVMSKRSGAIKRLKLECMTVQNVPKGKEAEAELHRQKLQDFYDNVKVSHAVDANLKSGKGELIEQMMSALAYKWAVHEIIWQPSADGTLSARFNFIPLWFFENRIGRLRFLEVDYQLDGRELEEGSWMVTCGPGLMEPCAVAYLYKSLAMKWWLRYIEGHADPVKVGTTNAPRGSTNFNAMNKALKELVDSVLLNKDETITRLNLAAQGELPYLPMADEMNRMMATIWRGADLSTISGKTSQGGQGALLQGKEEHNLQCDDADRLSETLNFQVDPQVIGWHFGEGTKPLAYAKIVVPPLVDNQSEIAVVNALAAWGIPPGKKQVLENLGRSPMSEGDEPITPPPVIQPGAKPVQGQGDAGTYRNELESANEKRIAPAAGKKQVLENLGRSPMSEGDEPITPPPVMQPGARTYKNELEAVNEKRVAPDIDAKLLIAAKNAVAASTEKALLPLADALDAVLMMPNEARPLAYQRLKDGLPEMLDRINRNPANAEALEEAMASAWFNGFMNAEVQHEANKK